MKARQLRLKYRKSSTVETNITLWVPESGLGLRQDIKDAAGSEGMRYWEQDCSTGYIVLSKVQELLDEPSLQQYFSWHRSKPLREAQTRAMQTLSPEQRRLLGLDF